MNEYGHDVDFYSFFVFFFATIAQECERHSNTVLCNWMRSLLWLCVSAPECANFHNTIIIIFPKRKMSQQKGNVQKKPSTAFHPHFFFFFFVFCFFLIRGSSGPLVVRTQWIRWRCMHGIVCVSLILYIAWTVHYRVECRFQSITQTQTRNTYTSYNIYLYTEWS